MFGFATGNWVICRIIHKMNVQYICEKEMSKLVLDATGLNRIIIVLSTQITQCLADVYLFTFFLHSKFSNQHPCCTLYNEVIFTTYLLKNLEH